MPDAEYRRTPRRFIVDVRGAESQVARQCSRCGVRFARRSPRKGVRLARSLLAAAGRRAVALPSGNGASPPQKGADSGQLVPGRRSDRRKRPRPPWCPIRSGSNPPKRSRSSRDQIADTNRPAATSRKRDSGTGPPSTFSSRVPAPNTRTRPSVRRARSAFLRRPICSRIRSKTRASDPLFRRRIRHS